MSDEALLIRFRDKDSKEGVSRATMKEIARALDLSETAAVHRALAEFAQRYVPQEQHRAIAAIVRKRHGGAVVMETLFDESSKVKPGGSKRVSASRPR